VLDRDRANYAEGTADETRHSLGLRLFGARDRLDWNYEFVYQGGDFGNEDIRAWTVASITGYTLSDLKWAPRLALSANIASGDDDPADGELNTFNPLFPNLAYFEEAAVLAPQNFYNIEPEITVSPTEKLSVSLDWNFFWRLQSNDAVYARGLNPLAGTASASGHFVAHVPSISVDYQLNRHVALDLSFSYFFAGDVIDHAGGDDITFVKLEASVVF
jgi:hypothetical protein